MPFLPNAVKISVVLCLFVPFLFVPLPVQAAEPGPVADAGPQIYDVNLASRQFDTYSGQFVFEADPDQVDRDESGELLISLVSNQEDGADLSAQGTWWAFLCFWFAMAETETDGQMFAMGFRWHGYLLGKARVIDGTGIQAGRYRLFGQQAADDPAQEEPSDEEPSDEEPVDEEPSAEPPSNDDSSGDEVIQP